MPRERPVCQCEGMPYADTNGIRLYYEDTGGQGTPVVLSHGFFMDREMFAPQVAVLGGKHRIVTWDERGHGDTEDAGEPFTYWDSARDCLGLLDHLGVDRAVLGGMSQGGYLSLRAALLAPERVAGLVLIDTQAGVEDADARAGYEHLFDRWRGEGPSDDLAHTIAGLIINDPAENDRWVAKWQRRYAGSAARVLDRAARTLLDRDDISDRVAEIRCPALVVHGTDDPAIGVEIGRELCGRLPNCTAMIPVEGAAHAANLTHPEPVNAALRDFLARFR